MCNEGIPVHPGTGFHQQFSRRFIHLLNALYLRVNKQSAERFGKQQVAAFPDNEAVQRAITRVIERKYQFGDAFWFGEQG